jgi:hypothetical protein
MAPSATNETTTGAIGPKKDVAVSKQPEIHVHGGEDKTPLEAISHGPLVLEGEFVLFSHKD